MSVFFFNSLSTSIFEVIFLFKFCSLSSKFVFFAKAAISFLLAKFACANLAANFCEANL